MFSGLGKRVNGEIRSGKKGGYFFNLNWRNREDTEKMLNKLCNVIFFKIVK